MWGVYMVLHIITVWYIMLERDQFKESDRGRSYSTHVSMRNAYRDWDRKHERMRPLGRFMQMVFKDIIFGYLDWVCLCQDTKL
jgi:hypothetical protein